MPVVPGAAARERAADLRARPTKKRGNAAQNQEIVPNRLSNPPVHAVRQRRVALAVTGGARQEGIGREERQRERGDAKNAA